MESEAKESELLLQELRQLYKREALKSLHEGQAAGIFLFSLNG